MTFKPLALLAATALAATLAAGCAKSSDQSSTTTTTTTTTEPTTAAGTAQSAMAAAGSTALGDPVHGKQIFSANCATCHGPTGTEGGVGPSLKNEKSRKNYPATIAWIKNPAPPMPKLYPSPLSEKDVDDVAAFVQTL
jgi:mono/diheme cytochrome c family protein